MTFQERCLNPESDESKVEISRQLPNYLRQVAHPYLHLVSKRLYQPTSRIQATFFLQENGIRTLSSIIIHSSYTESSKGYSDHVTRHPIICSKQEILSLASPHGNPTTNIRRNPTRPLLPSHSTMLSRHSGTSQEVVRPRCAWMVSGRDDGMELSALCSG